MWAKLLLVLTVGVLIPAMAGASVFKGVPPERRAAAGLDKLTAAELAELESLIVELRAESPAASAAAPTKGPAWLKALITLREVEAKPAVAEALESELVGEFTGWTGRTVFRLRNGQVWQQDDRTTRYDAPRQNPRVKIYPGMLGAFWLEVEGIKQPVKVKPVTLQ